MGEVRAAPGAHLDHPTVQTSQQLPAVLGCTATLSNVRDLRIDAGEYGMSGVLNHQSTVPFASPVSSMGWGCGAPTGRQVVWRAIRAIRWVRLPGSLVSTQAMPPIVAIPNGHNNISSPDISV